MGKNEKIQGSLNFGHTDPSFCTPPMTHENELLLFFVQKNLRPLAAILCFCKIPTLAGHSQIAEGLPDPLRVTE